MAYWFYTGISLKSIDISNLDTSQVNSLAYTFFACFAIENIDLSSLQTSQITNLDHTFNGCASLKSLDLSNLDTTNVTNMTSMFENANKLITIFVTDKFSVANVQYSTNMFKDCSKLVGGGGTTYDASHTDKTYAHIDGGLTNPGYFTAKTTLLSKNNKKPNEVLSLNNNEKINDTKPDNLPDSESNPIGATEYLNDDIISEDLQFHEDVTDENSDLAGAGEAAALLGAPLALAALGFRRRISGKHVKIK